MQQLDVPAECPVHRGLSRRAMWAGGEPIASVLMAKTLAHPELISLAAGFVDQETLPVGPVTEALGSLMPSADLARAALQYGTTIGLPALREAILARLLQSDGATAAELNLSLGQVVVTAGSNQLLHLLVDTLADPDDLVLCGAPSYFVFLGTLANLGVRAAGVATDKDGLIPEAVEEELARRRAAGELQRVKAIYVTSYFDNPTGATVPTARRAELVEIAQRWSTAGKIYLVEDAAYRDLRYYGEDLRSVRSFDEKGDTVVLTGTFSKSFSPGIRVGYGALPPALVEPVLSQKGNIDFGSPNFNQHLMAAVLRRGLFDAHLEVLRAAYGAKIDVMLAAAEEYLAPLGVSWIQPRGGLYVWVRLPEPIDTGLSGPLFDVAAEEGVLYVPGEYCYPAEGRPAARNMLRLSFGVPSCERIRQGMEALARAIRRAVE